MGQFIAPDSLDHTTKCAVILYPSEDSGLFLAALRGQIAQLSKPYIWEAPKEIQEQISQIWIQHELMTDEVFFKADCEFLPVFTGDESMDINVTTNCNCGGGCSSAPSEITVVCGEDGSGGIYLPPDEDIVNEFTDDVPESYDGPYDPEQPMPPELQESTGIDDWQTWDEHACKWAKRNTLLIGRTLRVAESSIDYISTVANIVTFFSWAGLTYLIKKGGFALLVKALRNIAAYTQANLITDWLGTLGKEIESGDLHDKVMCKFYTYRHDIPTAKEQARIEISEWIINNLFSQDFSDWFTEFFEWVAPIQVLIDEFYFGEFFAPLPANADCSGCDGQGGTSFLLIDFDNNNVGVSENRFGDTFVVTDDYSGNLTIKCVVDGSGNTGGGGWNKATIQAAAGIAGNFTIDRIEFDVRNRDVETNNDPLKLIVGPYDLEHDFDVAALSSSSYTHFDFTIANPTVLTDAQDNGVSFYAYSNGPRESYLIDNIKIYYTEV